MRTRVAVILGLVVSLPAVVGFIWPGTVEYLATRGNRAWQAGDFEAAENYFARAWRADPASSTLSYNRGTARYRLQRFDEAAEDFRRAAEGGGEALAVDASYDLGNALFQTGDYNGAIQAYQATLRRNPADLDAKHNLELAQRMKERQQSQPNRQQDQQDEQDQQEQQDQQQQQEQQQPQERQQQRNQDQQERQQAERQQAQQGDQERPQASESGQRNEEELSEDEALRLLHALAAEDATVQKIIRQSPQRRAIAPGEKDW